MTLKLRTREEIAKEIAGDIAEGAYVNLGIGIPTLVSNYIAPGKEVIIHSENGILGVGPKPPAGEEDYDLINASKVPVTLLDGASYFHHADSFAMMRGGHLDIAVLGAFQVSYDGDLANWHTGGDDIPAVGGAMDLAVGAKEVWVAMPLLDRSGKSKLVQKCSYPLTAPACTTRLYSDHATFRLRPGGLRVLSLADGMTIDRLQEIVGCSLQLA